MPPTIPIAAMNRSRFLSWAFPAFLLLTLVPNFAGTLGSGAALAIGCVAMAACWLLVWLRLASEGRRPELSTLVILPFIPTQLALADLHLWPMEHPASAISWIILWIACGCIAFLCIMPDAEDRDPDSRMDGTSVLLGTLLAAYVIMQAIGPLAILARSLQ